MRGPVRVVKSAIVQTCAKKLKKTRHLGTAFFFTVNKHDNSLLLFTIISYQLAISLSDYCTAVDSNILKDKIFIKKKISSQFESLIIELLQKLEKQGKRV